VYGQVEILRQGFHMHKHLFIRRDTHAYKNMYTHTYVHAYTLLHVNTHTHSLSNIHTRTYRLPYVQCSMRPMRCFQEDSKSKYTMSTSLCPSLCSAPSSPPPCHWKYSRCVRYAIFSYMYLSVRVCFCVCMIFTIFPSCYYYLTVVLLQNY
jgi:hypothetical protein